MSVNDWQRIEDLFHDAAQLQGPARLAFLASQCNGDDRTLQEVTSLLAASENRTEFLEQPTFDLGIKILAQSGALEGRTIGHYEIVRLLGEGGMGEVYLAEDTKLERHVALKFLVAGLFDDHVAKDQLMREARAVAKLEHSHICPVYGLESIGDYDFIVMPFIEGETLDSLLRKEFPALDRVLEISEQIASALAAAHARGIIHRDVKPQNVLITEAGQAKILDFGLAKLVARTQNPASFDHRPTASQAGLIPGTVAYMSPEQVRGHKLDCTTDIFSFGIMLHEMLSGHNPFLRETREQTLKAIANDESPPLPGSVPPTLTELTQKCLQKEVASRYAVGDELLVDLRRLRADRARKLASAWRPATKILLVISLVLIASGFIAGGLTWRRATRVHSLAILPIVNETGDQNNDYLTNAMSPLLFGRLSDLPRLKLKLPTVLPSGKKDSVGRDLQVEAVLSGRIVKNANGKPSLQLSLISTADGKITWERTFDPQTDIIALQDATALGVTSNLDIWLSGNEKKLLAHRPADNQEAFSAYLVGRQYLDLKRKNKESIQTALSYFDKAIDLDPSFAEAYSARADCYVLMTNILYGPLPAGVAIDRALYNARKAIEINPLLADAHSALGTIHLRHDWDWEAAEKEFKLAIELNPDYAPAHYWYTNFLVLQRRFDESIRESETARRLDPYAPIYELNRGRALYYARRYDEAEAFFRTLLETNPNFEGYRHQLAYILFQQGKLDEAIDILQTLYKTNPSYAAAPLGYAYARAGKQSEAEDMLRFLDQSTTPTNPNPAHEKLIIYIGMRDWEKVFRYLDLSFDERFASVPFVMVDPFYDDLRGDARFAQLAERVHLAP